MFTRFPRFPVPAPAPVPTPVPDPDPTPPPVVESPPNPWDFAHGFDPSKSIWGEAGKNAYMTSKANEYFKTQASGSALFDQWKAINAANPLAARAFRHAVMGMGGGQNDFEAQLLQQGFGGNLEAYNQYRNAAHGAGQEGLESGFNLVTGEWDPRNANYGTYKVQDWNPANFYNKGAPVQPFSWPNPTAPAPVPAAPITPAPSTPAPKPPASPMPAPAPGRGGGPRQTGGPDFSRGGMLAANPRTPDFSQGGLLSSPRWYPTGGQPPTRPRR